VPTPAVAFLVRQHEAVTGIAISASHNPYHDNGIKLLSSDGFKWSREREIELEDRMITGPATLVSTPAEHHTEKTKAATSYVDYLVELAGGSLALQGLEIAVDAANGAASAFLEPVFGRLGVEIHTLHDQPDGSNINRGCGSTHPEIVAAWTREKGADLGISFDGDADRALLADERGQVRDGDAILYLWATELLSKGQLEPRNVVATSMSNLGLERALADHGIGTKRCDVGDRAVVETMLEEGIDLGGEQSGHIVHLPSSTTGDGLLTALQIARIVHDGGKPLSQRLEKLRRYPQLLRNVPVKQKEPFENLPGVQAAASDVERQLGDDGRLVLRYSGTEPLARIMLEGPDQGVIEALGQKLADVLQEELS
jgi:phosphoglucosamine mutase